MSEEDSNDKQSTSSDISASDQASQDTISQNTSSQHSVTNNSKHKSAHASLKQLVLELLQQFPLGISEYDLIKAIQASGHLQFKEITLWDSLSLFQTHFILFNTLYQLRSELWQQQTVLEIGPLKIMLYGRDDSTADSTQMTEHDPLQEYYLDINNLEQMSAEDVTTLLASFWVRLGANEQRNEALKILELEDPVDFKMIKKQYRRLAMQHHPDRGGDHVKLQTLNYALEILQKGEIKKVLK